ncbi:nuclear valosin-containing protein-like [Anaeramoeba flamelloides]|uniref:Nuclear valosin-containing protein-like n=1 Tax=Anaeramoeba flamelloides TaxID=1746091 RepID=A0AAV7YRM6_9EUKA|nr:nuclear valosin-containing protein-like [Anaeramoeba flamelloides]
MSKRRNKKKNNYRKRKQPTPKPQPQSQLQPNTQPKQNKPQTNKQQKNYPTQKVQTSDPPKEFTYGLNQFLLETNNLGSLKEKATQQKNSKKKKKRRKNEKESLKKKSFDKSQDPQMSFKDLGGMDNILKEIHEIIIKPLIYPEVYQILGTKPPRGILLHGPPGCGKTLLAKAIAGELLKYNVNFINISGPELIKQMSGESEREIRKVFRQAKQLAPCLVFIDEIDSITPKRDNVQREMERRIVSQLLTCLSDITSENDITKTVIVIGATNRPDSLDSALRRAGRFDKEIVLGIPDEHARKEILQVVTKNMKLEDPENFDFSLLARKTPGYVGADLFSLKENAGVQAIQRIFKEKEDQMKYLETNEKEIEFENKNKNEIQNKIQNMESLESQEKKIELEMVSMQIQEKMEEEKMEEIIETNTKNEDQTNHTTKDDQETNETKLIEQEKSIFGDLNLPKFTQKELQAMSIKFSDFEKAIKFVQPSAKREGFTTIPDVKWEDVGALHKLKEELRISILLQIEKPESFKKYNLDNPAGVLLYGPPGCGKTLLAKAIANKCGCSFISVKGPELLNKYVGESELAVRQIFSRGRSSKPCIIFFDEFDSLCPKRESGDENRGTQRVVNQLLTEMDGVEERKGVFVIAATNRPDIIDRAMLRPGRLSKPLYVPLPSFEDRIEILKTLLRKVPKNEENINFKKIAKKTEGFSGADLNHLVTEASQSACLEYIEKENINSNDDDQLVKVCQTHFDRAFLKVNPSVSKSDKIMYEKMRNFFQNND